MSLDTSQYNFPLAPIIITPSQINTRILVPIGGSFQRAPWIEVNNESPYLIQVLTFQGTIFGIQPQTVDKVPLDQGTNSFIIQPISLLPLAAPSSQVQINVYPFGEPSGAYPYPLVRQTTPVSASSKAGFTTSVILQTTVANTLVGLSLFNPANSGVTAVIYRAVYTSTDGTTKPILANANADPAWPLSPTFGAKVIPPAFNSQMSATATQDGVHGATTFVLERALAGGNTYEFSPYPDQTTIFPGHGLTMQSTIAATTSMTQMGFDWTEQ